MVFTARSYARMAAAFPVAGSTYAYSQKVFGAPIGFLAGWSLLLDYLFLREHNVLNNVVLPLIGLVLTIWLWFSLSGRTLITGLCWLAVGLIVLAIATRGFTRPTPVLAIED